MKLLVIILFILLSFTNLFFLFKELKKEINFIYSSLLTLLATSILYFLILISNTNLLFTTIVIDLLLLFSLYLLFRKQKKRFFSIKVIFKACFKLDVLFIFIIIFSLIIFLNQTQKWGLWDAWAIWSLHAKFLFYPDSWKNLFDPALAWNHTDYPLFLPSIIGLLWNITGKVSSLIPFLIGLIPYLLIIIFFYKAFENKIFGLICIFLILIDNSFITRAASQYADTYLALFIVLSYYGILQTKANKNIKVLPILTGIIASGAMWVKNEGLLFFIIFSILWFFSFFNSRKQIIFYVLGSLPILILLLLFKFIIAPQNDLISSTTNNYFEKLGDFNRYVFIYRYFRDYFLYTVPSLFLLIIAAIFSKRKEYFFPILSLLVVFLGYFFIYVISPYDLQWHLETSADRLIHQLTPALLLLLIPLSADFFINVSKNKNV